MAEELNSLGWRVLIIWECATKDQTVLKVLGRLIFEWIEGKEVMGSIPEYMSAEDNIQPEMSS